MEKKKNNVTQPPAEGKNLQKMRRMIVSVVLAVVVWVLVVNVVNPEITEPFKDVTITYKGEAYLRDKGFVIVNKHEIPDLSIKVKGTRRNLLNGARRINVEVDVTGIDKKGKIVMPVKLNVPDNISVEKQSFSSVELMVEPRYDKSVSVIAEQLGDVSQESRGNIVSSVPEIEEIMVSGSVSDVESIKCCIVTVDVSGLEKSGKTVNEIRFVDKEGRTIPQDSSVFCSTAVVSVNNTIYKRHVLDIDVEADPLLRRAFKVDYDLRDMNMPVIDVGVLSGKDAPKKITAFIPNGEYKPGEQSLFLEINQDENLYIPDYKLSLKINLIPLKEKKTEVHIQLKNIPEGLEAVKNEYKVEKKLLIPEDFEGEVTGTVDCTEFVQGVNEGRIKLVNEHIQFEEFDDKITVNLIQK